MKTQSELLAEEAIEKHYRTHIDKMGAFSSELESAEGFKMGFMEAYEQFKPKWVRVEEQLPEVYKGVVLWIDVIADTYVCESVTCGSYQRNGNWSTDRDGGYGIQEIIVRKWLLFEDIL